jgi:hypothetical protein
MKNKLTTALLTSLLFLGSLAAHAYDPYDLSRLDVLKTCKAGTKQEVSAELALSFTKAIFAWHIGDQVSMLHPEFIAWHSAMTDLLVTYPALNSKVPFKNGQYTKQSIVATMAAVAFSNDSEAYQGTLKHVNCVGDDKVVLVGDFQSIQIQRDANTGCIQYRAPYTSSLKMIVELKDMVVDGEVKTLVHRFDTIIDENSTVKARADIAQQVATQKPLPPEPGSCKTQKMIFDEFQAQVVH